MKIYLINLDRSPQRLNVIRRRLKEQHLSFERLAAVDGQKLSEEECQSYTQYPPSFTKSVADYARKYGGKGFLSSHSLLHKSPLTKGEIACFLSHRKAIKTIAEGGQAFGAVLEDDALLSSQAKNFLSSSAWIPRGVDFIKLDRSCFPCCVSKKKMPLEGGFSLHHLKSLHLSACGYIISQRLARQIYPLLRYATISIDILLFSPKLGLASSYKVMQLYPAVIEQNFFPKNSIIDKERQQRKKQKLSLLQILRRETERLEFKHGLWLRLRYWPKAIWGQIPWKP